MNEDLRTALAALRAIYQIAETYKWIDQSIGGINADNAIGMNMAGRHITEVLDYRGFTPEYNASAEDYLHNLEKN